jgi:hypothetical protein
LILMATPSSREQLLRRFNGEPQDTSISFRTFLAAFSPQFSKGTISARLSELVQEGILERDSRGNYALAFERENVSPNLRELATVLGRLLPVPALQSTVLWDATPWLRDREDGVLAPVLVVETTRRATGSTARLLIDQWPTTRIPHIEEFADRDTLLEAVFGAMELQAPRSAQLVLIGPSEEKIAATLLQPDGCRIASAERILADMLDQSDPGMAAVARLRLTSPSVGLSFSRLLAAAQERDLLPSVFAILTQLRTGLSPELRAGFEGRLKGAAKVIVAEAP